MGSSSPRIRGENKTYLKPPPNFTMYIGFLLGKFLASPLLSNRCNREYQYMINWDYQYMIHGNSLGNPPNPVKVQFTSYKWSYGPLLITVFLGPPCTPPKIRVDPRFKPTPNCGTSQLSFMLRGYNPCV